LNIHGMANRGILNGKLSNWTLTRVHIVANGWAGWDGDLGCGTSGCSSDSGTMTFQSVEIAWNGCTEQYPTHNIYACWAQSNNGYGDGFGTAQTGGHWTFTDSYFHHNTSDGLDLLYADSTATVTVERSRSEGNAGNQMKIAGTSTIENSVIVGNCSYFQGVDYIVGNNSNSGNTSGDNCRAYGNALVVSLGTAPGATNLHSVIRYNSITSEGNCLILAINGSASASVQVQNNLLIGAPYWIPNDGSLSCLFYWDSAWSPVTFTKNWAWKVKPNTCPSGSNCTIDPQIDDSSLKDFDPVLLAGSPLISAADKTVGTVPTDFRNLPRPGAASPGYDIGAVQYQGACDEVTLGDDIFTGGGFEVGDLPSVLPCVGTLVTPDFVVPPHP
ncbi:MAG TPA: choice-of-anchor Q domain-containing protein, partial [Rudaea sp.]|nr:choice-of-anchor Q domain-containing protein [Rudaea sp.]